MDLGHFEIKDLLNNLDDLYYALLKEGGYGAEAVYQAKETIEFIMRNVMFQSYMEDEDGKYVEVGYNDRYGNYQPLCTMSEKVEG